MIRRFGDFAMLSVVGANGWMLQVGHSQQDRTIIERFYANILQWLTSISQV